MLPKLLVEAGLFRVLCFYYLRSLASNRRDLLVLGPRANGICRCHVDSVP